MGTSSTQSIVFNRYVTSRTVDNGDGPKTWRYSYGPLDITNGYKVTVTDPNNNDAVTTFLPIVPPGTLNWVQTDFKQYQGSSGAPGSTVLLEKQTQYQSVPNPQSPGNSGSGNARTGIFPSQETVTNLAGQVVTTVYKYDSGFVDTQVNCADAYHCVGNGSQTVPYGSNTSTTVTTNDGYQTVTSKAYEWQVDSSGSYLQANFLNLPASISVTDGNGSLVSAANWRYDETPPQASNISIQHAVPSTSARGHATSSVRTLLSPGSSPATVTNQTSWFDTGVPYQTIDAKGQIAATYTYDPAYAGAYPTTVANALGQQNVFTYDQASGEVVSHTDANSNVWHFCYQNDGRLAAALKPDGGATQWVYDDHNHIVTTSVLQSGSASSSCPVSLSGALVTSTKSLDGGGRVKRVQISAGSQVVSTVDTAYDNVGRVYSISDPYVTSVAGSTLFGYDALGRKLSVTHSADGSSQRWTYQGNTIDFWDEANSHTTYVHDAVNRLSGVLERTGTQTLETDYVYDLLNNLRTVNQFGVSGETPRSRSFTYDSLSRLITANNPETGTICYGQWSSGSCMNGYDANGNLLTKTDARGQSVAYAYDALNRVVNKKQSGSLVAEYFYDGNTSAYASNFGSTPNFIGRLSFTRSYLPTGALHDDQYFAYDPMGRLKHWIGSPPSEWGWSQHEIHKTYDLAGNATLISYPDGRSITQTFDGAGRLASVYPTGTPAAPYVASIGYLPSGAPQKIVLGNGVTENFSQNSRLQPCESNAFLAPSLGGAMIFDRQLFYAPSAPGSPCGTAANNNGNIWHILDGTLPQQTAQRTQDFTYDGLNRLQSWDTQMMAGQHRHQNFSYDSFGNLSQASTVPPPNNAIDPLNAPAAYDANNHLTPGSAACLPMGVSGTPGQVSIYDAAGNVGCSGVQNYTGQQYVWDPESRLSQVWAEHNSNTYYQSATYSYDAQGNRIRADQYVPGAQAGQSVPSTFREYSFYDGQMLAEKDQTGAWTDYIYANVSRIARIANQKPLLHIHGVRDSSVRMDWGVEGPIQGVPANVIGLTIQAGDRLAFTTMQNLPMYGGVGLVFQDGTGTGAMTDIQSGTPMWVNGTSDQAWHHLVGSLDAYQGKTVASVYAGIHNQAPAGTFDVWVDNLAIYRADGSVLPIFTGGQSLFAPNLSGSPGGARNMSNGTTVGTVDDRTATSYYASDHLGTTQVELAGGGWPISRSEFAPFGQELDTSYSVNRYKFTGKERDAESGLDYFGARYFSSSAGRFISPDWASKPEAVPYSSLDNPQSLNLYSYVNNNPLSKVDSDGHSSCNTTGAALCNPTSVSHAIVVAISNGMNAGDAMQAAQQAQQQNPNQAVGNTTEGSLAKVLTNEDGSLSTPKGGNPQQLVDGKTALANAIYNNANLAHPEKVAPATGTPSAQDSQIMQDVVTSRTNGGADPVQGRVYYGTSHTPELTSRSAGNGLNGAAGRESVFASFGPFKDSISSRPTYIYIYNNPGH